MNIKQKMYLIITGFLIVTKNPLSSLDAQGRKRKKFGQLFKSINDSLEISSFQRSTTNQSTVNVRISK